MADRPVDEISHGLQRVDLANGWQLVIWWIGGRMGPLHQARGPAVQMHQPASSEVQMHQPAADTVQVWTYGCDRWPDWSAGPEAVVLDPLVHLLTPAQLQRLEDRLQCCSCWPAPVPLPPEALMLMLPSV